MSAPVLVAQISKSAVSPTSKSAARHRDWCVEIFRGPQVWKPATQQAWKPALQRMPDSDQPYLLDVITPYTEHVLPFIPAGKTMADMIYK